VGVSPLAQVHGVRRENENGPELVGYRTGHRREHRVRVRANQPDRADHDHQNHRKHDRVFGDVLTFFVMPQELTQFSHSILLEVHARVVERVAAPLPN